MLKLQCASKIMKFMCGALSLELVSPLLCFSQSAYKYGFNKHSVIKKSLIICFKINDPQGSPTIHSPILHIQSSVLNPQAQVLKSIKPIKQHIKPYKKLSKESIKRERF